MALNIISHGSATKKGLPLKSKLSIEEALQEVIVSNHKLVTVVKDVKSIEQVSLNDIVAAIAKPKTTQTGEANAYL